MRSACLPDQLHVGPVRHDAVLHAVLQAEQAAQLLATSADEVIAICGAGHDADMLGPADVGADGALGRLVAGEANLDDARALVAGAAPDAGQAHRAVPCRAAPRATDVVDDDRLVRERIADVHGRGATAATAGGPGAQHEWAGARIGSGQARPCPYEGEGARKDEQERDR